MLRFLRLFAAFRALEADRDATVALLREELQREASEKMLCQDRLDAVMADRSKLWDMVTEAVGNERETLKTMANYRIQSTYGVTPYPEAGTLPESRQPEHIENTPRWLTPSERVAQHNKTFMDKLVAQNKH